MDRRPKSLRAKTPRRKEVKALRPERPLCAFARGCCSSRQLAFALADRRAYVSVHLPPGERPALIAAARSPVASRTCGLARRLLWSLCGMANGRHPTGGDLDVQALWSRLADRAGRGLRDRHG